MDALPYQPPTPHFLNRTISSPNSLSILPFAAPHHSQKLKSLPKLIPSQHTHIIQFITKTIKSALLGSPLQAQSVCSQPCKFSSSSSPLPGICFSDRVDLPNSNGAMPLTFSICMRGGCVRVSGVEMPPPPPPPHRALHRGHRPGTSISFQLSWPITS